MEEFGTLLLAYILGSIPFGLLAVKLRTGKDIREIGSGRTGTTNTLRAAGPVSAIITFLLDVLKGAGAVLLARWLTPDNLWLEVLAPTASILGHNYSIFLAERDENGRFHLRGGAGGAPALGGALGLWPASLLILLPVSILIYFGLGYASVTTMTVPLVAMIAFSIRAWLGYSPWLYVLYILIAEILLLWALRPNIRRLLDGSEHGLGLSKKNEEEKNLEKFNCIYCGYGNGLAAYAKEIIARTEQYWCPIKHATHVKDPHSRYHHFFEYGDAEGYANDLGKVIRKYDDKQTIKRCV